MDIDAGGGYSWKKKRRCDFTYPFDESGGSGAPGGRAHLGWKVCGLWGWRLTDGMPGELERRRMMRRRPNGR